MRFYVAEPNTEAAIVIATALCRAPALRSLGLLSNAGQACGAAEPAAVRTAAERERALRTGLADRLGRTDVGVKECPAGSTPTVFLNDSFDGLTEARPGNYGFMDQSRWRSASPNRTTLPCRCWPRRCPIR